MKPNKYKRDFVTKAIKKWKPRLFLGEWHIDVSYLKTETSETPFAECRSSPMYLEATINIFPSFWTMPRYRWEHTIVHELAHCQTAKIHQMLTDALNGKIHSKMENEYHIEQLTERIANIVYQQEWEK